MCGGLLPACGRRCWLRGGLSHCVITVRRGFSGQLC
jgi:hypothetical protein